MEESGLEICPQCHQNHEEMRQRFRESLFLTARVLAGFKDMTPNFHGRMAAWVEHNIRSGNRKMLALASRVFFKTSLLTIAFTIFCIINNPRVRILMVQQSQTKVRDVMKAIRGVLKGTTFAHFFPELVPTAECRFSDTEIEVPRDGNDPEPTLSARGIGSSVVGGHYDVQILDDVIGGDDQAESATEMENAIRWFKHSAPLFVDYLTGVQMVIGTRWSLTDLYQYIMDSNTFAVWETGCRYDERAAKQGFPAQAHKSLFPEKYPDHILDQMESLRDPLEWAFQMDNKPIAKGLRRFDHDMMQYYRWVEYGKLLARPGREGLLRPEDGIVTMMVDPAVGETAESDEFAIVVTSWWQKEAEAAVLEAYSSRITPVQQSEKIIELYKKWKKLGCSPRVGIEQGGYQAALRHSTLELQRQHDCYFYIEPISPRSWGGPTKKARRIEALQPYFANRQVWLGRDQDKLVAQLLAFQPKADGSTGPKHDDLMDALAYNPKYWRGRNFDDREDPNEGEDPNDWLSWDDDSASQTPNTQTPFYNLALSD